MAARKKAGRGGARPGSGRKPVVPGEPRINRVMVNLTDRELSAARLAAGRKPVSALIREALIRYLSRREAQRNRR